MKLFHALQLRCISILDDCINNTGTPSEYAYVTVSTILPLGHQHNENHSQPTSYVQNKQVTKYM